MVPDGDLPADLAHGFGMVADGCLPADLAHGVGMVADGCLPADLPPSPRPAPRRFARWLPLRVAAPRAPSMGKECRAGIARERERSGPRGFMGLGFGCSPPL